MAEVQVKVAGGRSQIVDASDIRELKSKLALSGNYTAAINGDGADDSTRLDEGDYVTLAQAVKGGAI